MYITDLTHSLDASGAIASRRGPARKLAEFLTSVVAHASASNLAERMTIPPCVHCRDPGRGVDAQIDAEGRVAWTCTGCGTAGIISNWRNTAWDSTDKTSAGAPRPRRRAAPAEDLGTFLRKQEAGTLADLLLGLAAEHEAVAARLERLRLADRPDELATKFRRTLAGWRRSKRFLDYSEASAFGHELHAWLVQVERELLPKHPEGALSLFEAFIEADTSWFERADDSNGVIGDAVRAACRCWLQSAAACVPPPGGWTDRVAALFEADDYGAREELLRQADLLGDEVGLRRLVARFESRLESALAVAPRKPDGPSYEVFRLIAALSLFSQALRDPDIRTRATLKLNPHPNPLQRLELARAYLDADRPEDALLWLQAPGQGFDDRRENLLATALERLDRIEESAVVRKNLFERSVSSDDLVDWIKLLPESARAEALAHARALAMRHDDVANAAALLLHLGDGPAAEQRLLTGASKLHGRDYIGLVPLAKALQARGCSRGETLVYRALLDDILDRAYSPAYRHAARYLTRLAAIARTDVDLAPLTSHADFELDLRLRHKRKLGFWGAVERAG
jgi:hypothetical protein